MRKFIPLIAFPLLVLSCKKKEVIEPPTETNRIVLIEVFTNTGCFPCKDADHLVDSLFTVRNDLVVIKYHMNSPYPGDPFWPVDSLSCQERWSYYQGSVLPFTPVVVIDGIIINEGIENIDAWTNQIEERLRTESPCSLDLDGVFYSDARMVELNVDIEGEVPTGTKLRIALVESNLEYNAPNGDSIFHNVLRKMIPSAGGTDISGPGVYTITFHVDTSFSLENLNIVVFLQSSSKEVLQSGYISLSSLSQDLGYNFEIVAKETLYNFVPQNAYYDTLILSNTGIFDDIYLISLRTDDLPPDWVATLCVGGMCFPPGVTIPDTLSTGEVDSLITVDIFAGDSLIGSESFLEVNVSSLNFPSLSKTLRIWFR
jgi:hypothetical protein